MCKMLCQKVGRMRKKSSHSVVSFLKALDLVQSSIHIRCLKKYLLNYIELKQLLKKANWVVDKIGNMALSFSIYEMIQ